MMFSRLVVTLMLMCSLSACSNFDYYTQAVIGQMELLSARRGLEDVISDDSVSPEVKTRIQLAQSILQFAETEIGLPVESTFNTYADIGRPYLVWNVFVAKKDATRLETFCFPIAGCVGYKGFFDKENAKSFSLELDKSGFDTYVGGVAAYSSLGWFSDPLLNTFIHRSDESLAALIFHELSHKILYVKDDTEFNESFATTVERYALEKWLASRDKKFAYNKYIEGQVRQAEVIDLILSVREKLSHVYGENNLRNNNGMAMGPELAEIKAEVIGDLRKDYQTLRESWAEGSEFEYWMKND
ncbi:MAG: putative aminopeptidase, partial [Candidatus Azotimanducaceae bacterium]